MGKWEWDGGNIKKIREMNGDTQDSLCYRIGINRSSLAEWETGKRIPTIENLYKIAKDYNVSIDYLCGLSKYSHDENASICELLDISDETVNGIRELSQGQKVILEILARTDIENTNTNLLGCILDAYRLYLLKDTDDDGYLRFQLMNALYDTMDIVKAQIAIEYLKEKKNGNHKKER